MLGVFRKKLFGVVTAVAVVAASLAIAIPALAAAPYGTMSLSTPNTSLGNGATFTVTINADVGTNMTRAFQADLNFDHTKLQAVVSSVTEGTFLSTWAAANGATTASANDPTYDNVSGQVTSITYYLRGGGTNGPTGTGTLATVQFHAITADTYADITFSNNLFTSGMGDDITPATTTNLRVFIGNPPEITAQNQTLSTNEDSSLPITLSAIDIHNHPLTYTITTPPTIGGITGTTPNISYNPNPNLNGPDSFVFTVSDGTVSTTGTVNITVNAVNDAPSFTKGADQTSLEGASTKTVTTWATAISKGPADESSQTLNFIVTNDHTSLFSVQPAVSPTGTLTYTPADLGFGVAHVSVSLHDNGGTANGGVDTSAVQTFNITITHVNHAPVAVSQSVLVSAGTAKSITLAGTDVDGDTLTYAILAPPSSTEGTLSGFNANTGVVTFTPASGFHGDTSFQFTVNDNTGTPNQVSNPAGLVSITVSAGTVEVNGSRDAQIEFTAPTGTISFPFDLLSADHTYTNTDKTMTINANTAWNIYVVSMLGSANGHMTKYNPTTGLYDTTVSLYDPLHIIAAGAAIVGPTVPGVNGQNVALNTTNQVLASATLADFNTLGSYDLAYGLTFSQHLYYVDPGLPAGYSYHVVAQFTSQAILP